MTIKVKSYTDHVRALAGKILRDFERSVRYYAEPDDLNFDMEGVVNWDAYKLELLDFVTDAVARDPWVEYGYMDVLRLSGNPDAWKGMMNELSEFSTWQKLVSYMAFLAMLADVEYQVELVQEELDRRRADARQSFQLLIEAGWEANFQDETWYMSNLVAPVDLETALRIHRTGGYEGSCGHCGGTGEGPGDGQVCRVCLGKGEVTEII